MCNQVILLGEVREINFLDQTAGHELAEVVQRVERDAPRGQYDDIRISFIAGSAKFLRENIRVGDQVCTVSRLGTLDEESGVKVFGRRIYKVPTKEPGE